MSEFVADASAVLAFARGEPGEKRVAKVRNDCLVVSLNLLEAFSKLVRYEMPADQVQGFLREAFPRVEALDRRLAETAAVLHATTRTLGLSYGDCACLAFGAARQATILTADRRWKEVKLDVRLELIR